ncbi:MAG: hypothetical protein HYZ49_03010 [Chloroflexi bacterium]|nr:hypothetical protein [Chloroflexota bacterium]
MPKRTNDFQRLVYLVRVNLADGAIVTESKMLEDRATGTMREVDVCIEGSVGGQGVIVSVECRDHQRVADVTWVEQLKVKHDRLPTNALILTSRAGFTPEAREVARLYGIQTFSLDDIESADFKSLFGFDSSLWAKSVTVSANKVTVSVLPMETFAEETVSVMPTNLIYTIEGQEVCQIGELVQKLLSSPRVGDYLLEKGQNDHVWFELDWEPPRDHLDRPLFMKKVDPPVLREIKKIHIQGPSKFQIEKFEMGSGCIGDVHVAWGKTEILGQDTMVVATKDSEGIRKMSVNFAGSPKQE